MKRITCFASLVIALAWSMAARAGGPPPVYLVIDKVVFEPTEEAPARIQIWGTFSLREGDSYGAPQRGYLYYAAPEGAEEKCRKEWAVLKKLANKKQLISFGICGEPNVRAHLRKPSDKVTSPIPYPHGKGGFASGENAERNFPALKKLLVSPATPVARADLTRMERCIGREPVYQSKSPKYCLPSEAGNGKALVTLSFPDWKDGNVTPATFTVPIVQKELKLESRVIMQRSPANRASLGAFASLFGAPSCTIL